MSARTLPSSEPELKDEDLDDLEGVMLGGESTLGDGRSCRVRSMTIIVAARVLGGPGVQVLLAEEEEEPASGYW